MTQINMRWKVARPDLLNLTEGNLSAEKRTEVALSH